MPRPVLVPMVLLATVSTVIASQALISGAFALATQAVALGLLPRLRVVHTHHANAGQTYVPFVNFALLAGSVSLVLKFGSSSSLAAAYGLSLAAVMLTTSIAMTAIARLYWNWRWPTILLVFVPLGFLEVAFVVSKSIRFLDGGFVPLSIGIVLFIVMSTWRWRRKATYAAYSSKRTMKVRDLIVLKETAHLFDRNAVLMVPKPLHSNSDNLPALMQLLWDRSGVLPKNIIFVEVVHEKVPYVHHARYLVRVFQRAEDRGCIVSVTVKFGFMEEPNVERVLENLARHHEIDLPADPHKWTVHASQEKAMLATGAGPFARARLRLFALLRQVSTPAYYYYGLGDEVQLSTEILPVRVR